MSDIQQGPDWWRATDGNWYPPQSPAPAPSPSPSPSPAVFGAVNPQGPGTRISQDVALEEAKGFLRSVFDFKLQSFVTPAVLRFLYLVSVIILGLGAVVVLLSSFASKSAIVILLALVLVPILFVLSVILTRMYFELIAAFFRIADDLRAVRRRSES